MKKNLILLGLVVVLSTTVFAKDNLEGKWNYSDNITIDGVNYSYTLTYTFGNDGLFSLKLADNNRDETATEVLFEGRYISNSSTFSIQPTGETLWIPLNYYMGEKNRTVIITGLDLVFEIMDEDMPIPLDVEYTKE